jgi:hypothetical protein
MNCKALLIVPLVATALAACSGMSGPEQVNATAPTVTYKFTNERELAEASQRAAAFCQSYGKSARLVGGPRSDLATYECY